MCRYVIDTVLLEDNIEKILTRASVPVIAVVKANSYGFGLEQMARMLKSHGLNMFAVTEIADLSVLRDIVDIDDDILVMRSTALEDEIESIIDANCIATIGSTSAYSSAVEVAKRRGVPLRCHVKIDTGLSRYGFMPDEFDAIRSCYESDHLRVEGIYTHLSSSFNNYALTKSQVETLRCVAERIEEAGFNPGIRHAANSHAFYNVEGCELDAIRIGSAFTGRLATKEDTGLRRVGYLEARVIDVRMLRAGASWGYGGRVKIKRDTLAAFVSAGIREGFGLLVDRVPTVRGVLSSAKSLITSSRQTVLINGKRYPVLSKAELSMTMVDVTGSNVAPGDTVIMDPNPLTVPPHVPRVYVEGSGHCPGEKAWSLGINASEKRANNSLGGEQVR